MIRGDRARGVAASLVTAALLLIASSTAQAADIDLGRCAGASRRDSTRCGRVTVPLDRSGAVPGTVSLKVRVRPPRRGPATGTIVALAGGPGQAATPLLPMIADALGGAVTRSRRIVTFDQRGTGGSGRLRCRGLAKAETPTQATRAVADCAAQLGARRTAYTTAASVEDLEAVRAALGVDKIAIFGVSYGTKVALDYAARHPSHVSRLVLDSVVLPEGVDPFMRTTLRSVPRVLAQLCAGRSACRFTRDPGADLGRLVARIGRRGGLSGVRYDGRGRARRVTVTAEQLLNVLLEGDFDPTARGAFPAAVASALDGDTAPLAKLVDRPAVGLDGDGDSDALFIATTCEDGGVPWPAGTPVAERARAFETMLAQLPAASLAPFDHATLRRSGIDYCAGWPEAPIAQPSGPLPDVPTLILSGDDDLRTPRSDAVALAKRLPSAQLVTVPEVGHSVLSSDLLGCADAALARFFAGRRVRDCELRLPRFVTPTAPTPRSLAAFAPAHGLPGRAGRTLAAVELSYLTFAQELLTRVFALLGSGDETFEFAFGGLRGGYARATRRSLVLRRYSVVPGVTLDMTIDARSLDEPVALRVGGRAAARGLLRIGERRVRGRLGGRAVDFSANRFGDSAARAAGAGGGAPEAEELPNARELVARLEEARRQAAERAPLAAAGPRLPGAGGAR